jgi:transposase-like protein
MEMAAISQKMAKCDKCYREYIILSTRHKVRFICKKCKRKENKENDN